MLIKHFTEEHFRTRDPLYPGRYVMDRRLVGSGTHSIAADGETYSAAADGWFDLPEEVAYRMLSYPGWRTPAQVDEAVSAGEIDSNDSPVSARKPKARHS